MKQLKPDKVSIKSSVTKEEKEKNDIETKKLQAEFKSLNMMRNKDTSEKFLGVVVEVN